MGLMTGLPTEVKAAFEEFYRTLQEMRNKQGEIDSALKKRSSMDPLLTSSLRKMEAHHDEMRDQINQLFRAKNRPVLFSPGHAIGSSELERKANQEVALWLNGDESKASSFRTAYGKAFRRYLRLSKDA